MGVLYKVACYARHLISDRSSIVIDSEDWHWVLGLGIVGAVPVVVVALLEEGVVRGLMNKHRGTIHNTQRDLVFNILHSTTQGQK